MTDTSTPTSATSRGRLGVATRLGLAVLLLAVMLAGILVLGRLASSDVMAMALTSVFFVLLAAGLFVLVRRRRELLVPLGAVYVLVAGGAGVVLGLPLITDDVVDEDVVVVDQPSAPSTDEASAAGGESGPSGDSAAGGGTEAEATGPQQVASGEFEARDHPGEGTATLVDTTDGTVLTLTDFATDNGPDLFVYLVPADAPAGSVEGFVDLGTLKGNVGDQQYDVPDDVDAGDGWRVVVWCRAFAVTFTEAVLT
ncbi:MAG: DM13 domain-containing protein [Jiangellales bacterium]